MFLSSYGLLFKAFLQEIGVRPTQATLIFGVSSFSTALGGYLTSPLLRLMSLRMLTFISTLIFNAGVICILLVKSVFAFHICQGILQGLGFGFAYNLSYTIINDYFVKKRLMAISLGHTAIAAINMLGPPLLKWSLNEFGFRGTVLLMSGLSLHNFISVALMQPVDWHMKRVELSTGSNEKLLHDKKRSEEAAIVPFIKITKPDGNLSKSGEKISSEFKEDDVIEKGIKWIDKSLCRTFLMSCVCVGPALALFADAMYADIFPQALHIAGWDKNNLALALSLYGVGDLVMRILFIFLSSWLQQFGSQELYILGVTIGLVSRLGMLWSKSRIPILLYIVVVGTSHCAVNILIPLVVADAVPSDKFTTALGMLMMLTGLINLVIGPAIGAVRELSESNGPAFYLIASCFAIIVLFWSIELCYKRNKHKRLQRREYLQKKINKQ
ncbi:monocarboxylate transporter 6-like isoform X2 [Trichoplusia ni]|nr:monocarboxylate transporter 6-like isoform X2 [Trichoplusia ni]